MAPLTYPQKIDKNVFHSNKTYYQSHILKDQYKTIYHVIFRLKKNITGFEVTDSTYLI